jgi:hypothetical protein
MNRDYTESIRLLDETEAGVPGRAAEENREIDTVERALLARARLIRINIEIVHGDSGWQERALEHALKAIKFSPRSYYAQSTLGQIYAEAKGREVESHAAFETAYQLIRDSDDLIFVTETRSRILLLLTAAMANRRSGGTDGSVFQGYLNEASTLREELPKSKGKVCTVFSLFRKTNITSDRVAFDIDKVRREEWALRGERA